MASAGGQHTLLLRSDGRVLAIGSDKHRQCSSIPTLPEGKRYVASSAGYRHSVVLRDDNKAFKFGQMPATWCEVPGMQDGIRYIEAMSGGQHTAMVTNDGQVILTGNDTDGQIAFPAKNTDGYVALLDLPEGAKSTKVFAGSYHTVVLTDDGRAFAFGDNTYGQCEVPELPAGIRYIDAAAGRFHTVLLRDDGEVLPFGDNRDGQLEVPPKTILECYVDITCGDYHTVACRNDGQVFAVGRNAEGQCDVPELPDGLRYGNLVVIVTASIGVGMKCPTGDLHVVCSALDGVNLLSLVLDPDIDETTVGGLRKHIAKACKVPSWSIRLFEQSGTQNRLLPFLDDARMVMDVFDV